MQFLIAADMTNPNTYIIFLFYLVPYSIKQRRKTVSFDVMEPLTCINNADGVSSWYWFFSQRERGGRRIERKTDVH